MTATTYAQARGAYWKAQNAFRGIAVQEIARLIPDAYEAVVLEMSDDPDIPRLRISHFRTPEGEADFDYEDADTWEEIDQIAADMEAFTWDEADSFLMTTAEGKFIIEKEDAA